jgi:DNA-binding transcriptional ArsR family regulator
MSTDGVTTRLDAAAELLRVLGTPVRLRIVDLLADRAYYVHELVDLVGVSQPLMSQHLRVLRAAGLVTTARRGRGIEYALPDSHIAHIVRDALTHAQEDS